LLQACCIWNDFPNICLPQAISHIFEISEDDHPLKFVGHARDIWWTLDFANAFVSPGVNSRGELVPSHGASRRRLGDQPVSQGLTSATPPNRGCSGISMGITHATRKYSKWRLNRSNLQLATGIAATTQWSINIALMIFVIT
jgi:hypothetical protein